MSTIAGGSVVWDLDVDDSKFNSGIKKAKRGAESLGETNTTQAKKSSSSWSTLSKVGFAAVATAAVAAGAIIVKSIGSAVKRVDTLNNFPKVMSNLGYGADEARKAIKALDTGVQGLPTSIDSIALAMQRIAPSSKNLAEATDLAIAMNNAILAGGAPAQSQAAAMEQLSQAILKGKFDMMEWRTISQAMPGQLSQMAKAFGIASGNTSELYSEMSDGNITMKDFQDKLMELNDEGIKGFASFAVQAKNSTGGISTGFANMQTAITRGVAKIIDSVGAENVSKAVATFGKVFEKGLTAVANTITFVIEALKPFFEMLNRNKGLLGDIGKALLAVGTAFLIAKGAIVAFGFVAKGVGLVIGLITSPLGLLVLAIAAVTVVLVMLERKFGVISSTAKSLWNIIQLFITGDFKGGIFGMSEDSPFIDALFKIRDVGLLVIGFIKGEFSKIMESVKKIFTELAKSMEPLLEAFKEFWSKHGDKVMTVMKVIGGVIAAIAIAPLVAGFLLFLGAIKILAVVLGFVARHFEVFKKIAMVVLAVALAPLIVIIGTLVIIIKAVIAAIKFLVASFKWTVNAVKATGKWITKTWNSIKTKVTDAIDTVTTTIMDAWNNVYTAVSDAVDATVTFITDAWDSVVDFTVATWQSIYNAVIDPLTRLWNVSMGIIKFMGDLFVIVFGSILLVIIKVAKFILKVWITAWSFIFNTIKRVVMTMWELIVTAFNAVSEFLVGVFTFIKDTIVGAWQAVYDFVAPIIRKIKDFILGVWEKVRFRISSIINGIKWLIVRAWQAVYNFVAPIVQSVINFIKTRWNNLKNNTVKIFNALKEFFTNVWNKIYSTIKGIVSKITRFFSGAWRWLYEKGKAIIRGLIDGIKAMGGALWRGVKSVADKIGKFFSGAWNWLFSTGKAIIQGLINGIGNMAGAVRRKVSEIADGIRSSIAGALKLRSPSRVMFDMGTNITEGLVNGIDKGIGKVKNISTEMAMNVKAPMLDTTSIGNEGVSNTENVTNINGNIMLGDKSAVDEFFARLSRNNELVQKGMSTI